MQAMRLTMHSVLSIPTCGGVQAFIGLLHCCYNMRHFLIADVAIRVNLSSCETFADLMVAMERQLQVASQHAHFPFKTIIDEVSPCPSCKRLWKSINITQKPID